MGSSRLLDGVVESQPRHFQHMHCHVELCIIKKRELVLHEIVFKQEGLEVASGVQA